MGEEEPLVLVVVQRCTVQLVGGLPVEKDGHPGQLDDQITVVSSPRSGESEAQSAASAGERDTEYLVGSEVAFDGLFSRLGKGQFHPLLG